MRLTRYTDYAMRVLLYLGSHPDRLCSIKEIAGAYNISQNHLMKVVNDLARAGYVASVRGRFGGIRLARPPQEISLGAVVRHTEGGLGLVDCASCVISPLCGLSRALNQALCAFLDVLDGYRLEDLIGSPRDMAALFDFSTPAPWDVAKPEADVGAAAPAMAQSRPSSRNSAASSGGRSPSSVLAVQSAGASAGSR